MKMTAILLGLTLGLAAHADPACDVYLDASSDEATLHGLIARTNLVDKLNRRLSDLDYSAINAPDEDEIWQNEARWQADAAAESITRRAAYTAVLSQPMGRSLLLQESGRRSAPRPTRDQIIEETIFAEFGAENSSYRNLVELRDKLNHWSVRIEKHLHTLDRIIRYLDRARWWAGGVHVPEASWYNVNPISYLNRARARQLAGRLNRRLQPDMTETELLLGTGHPVLNEITAEEGTARLVTFRQRLENTRDQLSVNRSLVEGRVNEIVTRVKALLPPRD